jgi:hypothetical protein
MYVTHALFTVYADAGNAPVGPGTIPDVDDGVVPGEEGEAVLADDDCFFKTTTTAMMTTTTAHTETPTASSIAGSIKKETIHY